MARGEELLLSFVVDGLVAAVGVGRVEEVLRHHPLTPVPLAGSAVAGLLNLRGQIVLAVDLRRRLVLADRSDGKPPNHVVVRTPDGLYSLLVDAIGDVVPVGHLRPERVPDRLRAEVRSLATAVYKLPDQLLVVFDVDRLVDTTALGPA